jgi:hypothetical protein
MSDTKSIIVGLFVVVGAVLLAVMIMWFGQVALFIRGGYFVTGHLPSAVGVRDGKRVHMDGIDVGEVTNVRTSQPDKPGVWVEMHINPHVEIPADADFVAQQSTIGDLYLDFQTTPKRPLDGAALAPGQLHLAFRRDAFGLWHVAEEPKPWPPPAWQFNIVSQPFWSPNLPPLFLPTDGQARVGGRIVAPSLLPEELVADVRKGLSTLNDLRPMAANIQRLTEPRTLADLKQGKQRNLWTMTEQFEVTAKTLQDQMESKDSNLNQLLANANVSVKELREAIALAKDTLKTADTTFKDVGKKADALATSLNDDAKKAADLMARIEKAVDGATATMKSLQATFDNVNAGKGTLGKLATDDDLYRALTTLIENLKTVADDTDRLMTMWRQQGIFAKEGK